MAISRLPTALASDGDSGSAGTGRPGDAQDRRATTGAYEDTGNPVSTTGPSGTSTYAYDPATRDLKGKDGLDGDEKYPNDVRGRNQAPAYPLLGLSL